MVGELEFILIDGTKIVSDSLVGFFGEKGEDGFLV